MEEQIVKVSNLNSYISSVLKSETALRNILVLGEVSGYKESKGHAYFTLKDNEAQISCCCFNCSKTYRPKDGEQILAKGSVDYYVAGGRLSLNIVAIQQYGKGALAIQLEKLKQKLLLEGYFNPDHKIEIPQFPKRVCVLTAKTGAVIKDIISTTRRTNKSIDLICMDTLVQGIDSARSVINNLKIADNLGFDVIIIARGGGSFEDLMSFNNEDLVKAVYSAKTPIISAVGHETDYTLCDLVADYRALTPTAAAQKIAYDESELLLYFNQSLQRINNIIQNNFNNYQMKLDLLSSRLNGSYEVYYSKNIRRLNNYIQFMLNYLNDQIKDNEHNLDNYSNRMLNSIKNQINNSEYKLNLYLNKLSAYNPANVLKKGYFIVKKDDEAIFDLKDIKVGDNLDVVGNDGQIKVNVLEVKNGI